MQQNLVRSCAFIFAVTTGLVLWPSCRSGIAASTETVRQVVAFWEEIDYRLWHIESEQRIESSSAVRAMEGHLYCEPL